MKNRLKELRNSNGYTLDDFAELTGVKRGTLSNYENGNTEPKLDTWQKLADALGVSVLYLQGLTDEKRTPEEIEKFYAEGNKMLAGLSSVNQPTTEQAKAAIDQVRDLLWYFEETDNKDALATASTFLADDINDLATLYTLPNVYETSDARKPVYEKLENDLRNLLKLVESQIKAKTGSE